MIIGDQSSFAIECYHEPIPNDTKRVFGRMCIWVAGNALGDINEPACMLNVTEGHLSDVLHRITTLDDEIFINLDDRSAFDLLNHAIYLGDERSDIEIKQDYEHYYKFDFLTNAGESFDHTKSFAILSKEFVRLLFTNETGEFHSAHVSKVTFLQVIGSFFVWLESEGKCAKG
jgi:hypothetical protein